MGRGWALLTKDYQTRQLSPKAILTTASPCPCNLMVPMGVGDRAGAVLMMVQLWYKEERHLAREFCTEGHAHRGGE